MARGRRTGSRWTSRPRRVAAAGAPRRAARVRQWLGIAAALVVVTIGAYFCRCARRRRAATAAAATPARRRLRRSGGGRIETGDAALRKSDHAARGAREESGRRDRSGDRGDCCSRTSASINQAIAESRAALASIRQAGRRARVCSKRCGARSDVLQATVSLMNQMRKGDQVGAAQRRGGARQKSLMTTCSVRMDRRDASIGQRAVVTRRRLAIAGGAVALRDGRRQRRCRSTSRLERWRRADRRSDPRGRGRQTSSRDRRETSGRGRARGLPAITRDIEQRCARPPAARTATSAPSRPTRETKTLALGANGSLELSNMSGDITVTAGSGRDVDVEIVAPSRGPHRRGRQARAASASPSNVDQRGDRATVEARYPERATARPIASTSPTTSPRRRARASTVDSMSGDVTRRRA